jgi:bacterioferritin-associated ferredoxin
MRECCSSSTSGKTTLKCPTCGIAGISVPLVTVKGMAKNTPDAKLNGEFYICVTPSCDIAYFNQNTVLRQIDVAIPLYWKDGANPKFVCYCNHVTEEEIINAVTHDNVRTLKDISRSTGAARNGKCLNNNPKGVCCHKDIEIIIQRTLENMKSV